MAAAHLVLEQARHHHAQNHLLLAAEAYRQTLLADPGSQPALLGLSLIARQSNQLQPALRMAQAALAANSHSALAWANLGDTLLALQHPHQARAALLHAVSLYPAQAPALAAAHYGLGNCCALQENYPAALAHFTCALEHSPNTPEFHFAVAFTHGKLGSHAQAIRHYRCAIQLRPAFASAWLNLGVELVADGRDQLAGLCYLQARVAAPHDRHIHISAHLNQGHLHRSRRHFPQALQSYLAALTLAPHGHARLSEIHVAFAYLHLEQHQFPQAWQSLRQAHRNDPGNPELHNAQGILLLAEESATRDAALIEQAIHSFQQAEAFGHKTSPSNRGNALLRLGRIQEALAAHQLAVNRDPHHPGSRYNLALTQLRVGNFTEGWRNYEARWLFREVHRHPRRFHQPRWQGQTLSPGETLLIYSEQGLGDTLQFLRYLPLVAQISPDTPILLEVQPALIRLLTPSPHARILAHGQPLPPFTHHIPLLSLPALFASIPGQFPGLVPCPVPYLAADPRAIQRRAADLAQLPGRKIGLNWAGNPCYRADHERSTTLQTFLPLLEIPGIHWISLQNGPAARQIEQIPTHLRPRNLSESDQDLADTAALMAHLHLVLTTDTAIAHLAGALGKPLWLLLPWQSDWRWMQGSSTTPWYPTARLFRQPARGDWENLIHRVATELRNTH